PLRRLPSFPPFPYTTLFRSDLGARSAWVLERGLAVSWSRARPVPTVRCLVPGRPSQAAARLAGPAGLDGLLLLATGLLHRSTAARSAGRFLPVAVDFGAVRPLGG